MAGATVDESLSLALSMDAMASRPSTKISDSLNYLNAVRSQFAENPEKYNRFLDIMKDFTSQICDPPGVIQRVSHLFHGNLDLILGFNIFLPMGYRIDVSMDSTDPDKVTVTSPSGIATLDTIASGDPNTTTPGVEDADPASSLVATSHPHVKTHEDISANIHAINYVKKIKVLYTDDPTIYEQFIDILKRYHKDQLSETEVHAQIQVLFQDAPDLAADFQDFCRRPITTLNQNSRHNAISNI